MSRYAIPILTLLAVGMLVLMESRRERPGKPVAEGCVFCHEAVADSDPSHPVSAFGCAVCHMGNEFSMEKGRAHATMVPNPGDLRVADRTCGQTSCHPEIVPRVKNSLMATNKGILKTIQYHWLGLESPGTTVADLLGPDPPENIAIGHYRKLCGGCHLWKRRGDRPGEIGRRGGGCSDCHVVDQARPSITTKEPWQHPRLTTRIPSENCVKCHNRSARIGLSYFGRFESAGYGTPYEGNGVTQRRLSGNRFFLNLEPDVHFGKAAMACIDCHTAVGVMGDGKQYETMGSQVDISCEACHMPEAASSESGDSLARRLTRLNRRVPPIEHQNVGVTKRGTPLYNLRWQGSRLLFFRKGDGQPIEMKQTAPTAPYHDFSGHERLSCQACHSKWMPQCYGCHLSYHEDEPQRDWLSGRVRDGRWRERRSYVRFSKPALGVSSGEKITPISPCQVFAENGPGGSGGFTIFTLAAFDPHTTVTESRACMDCHGDPKTLGLGEGILNRVDGQWRFRPTQEMVLSGPETRFPMDGYVDLEGNRLQRPFTGETRPFNRREMDRVLAVTGCLGCHEDYDDSIYGDFPKALKQFTNGTALPCVE